MCSASPPRRRELDNVMKKARKEGPDKSDYWNKKLIEVEEKDPNRCEQCYLLNVKNEESIRPSITSCIGHCCFNC